MHLGRLVVDLHVSGRVLDPEVFRDPVADDRLVHPPVLAKAAVQTACRQIIGEVEPLQAGVRDAWRELFQQPPEPLVPCDLVRVELDEPAIHVHLAARLHEADPERDRAVAEVEAPKLVPAAGSNLARPRAHAVAVEGLGVRAQPLALAVDERQLQANHID